MILFKLLLLPIFTIGTYCLPIPRAAAIAAAFPLSSLGNVAAIQFPSAGDLYTRLFYQDDSGDIIIHGTANGPFTTGQTTVHRTLVPAAQVLRYTPIAATVIGDATDGIHVYFLSPDHKLREVRFTSIKGWRGGDDCPNCVDHAGFSVAEDKALYALENPTSNVLRVGFYSPGTPGTFSEAVTANDGESWQLAALPNV